MVVVMEGQWKEIEMQLEKALVKAVADNLHLPIYLWSLAGEIQGRSTGWGWSLQVHFEDPTHDGGVKHVTISSGDKLSRELAEKLKQWLLQKAQNHPGLLEPRVEIYINC